MMSVAFPRPPDELLNMKRTLALKPLKHQQVSERSLEAEAWEKEAVTTAKDEIQKHV